MMRRKLSPLALAAALTIPALSACGNDPTGPNPGISPGDAPISFAVRTLTVAMGETVSLTSLVTLQEGTPLDDLDTATWTSSNENAVIVSPSGAMQAVSMGSAVITVEFQGYTTGIKVEVTEPGDDGPPAKEHLIG